MTTTTVLSLSIPPPIPHLNQRIMPMSASSERMTVVAKQCLNDLQQSGKVDSLPKELSQVDLSRSVLNKPNQIADSLRESGFWKELCRQDFIKQKFLGHILGNGHINGSNLEGLGMRVMPSFLLEYIQLREDKYPLLVPYKDHLAEMILQINKGDQNQQRSFLEQAQEITQKLQQLKSGQKYLMAGGWEEHGMLYEFEKTGNGTFNLAIYNLGAGVESYHEMLHKGFKRKTYPICYFKEVKASQLCLPYPFLIEHLLRLQSPLTQFERPGYRAATIYERCFGHLSSHRTIPSRNVVGFMSCLISGTCTWGMWKPWIAQTLQNVQRYKQWYAELKFNVLLLASKDLNQGSSQRLLLLNGAKDIQRSTAKLYCSNLISEEEAQTRLATCRELIEKIEVMEKNLQTKLEEQNIPRIPFEPIVASQFFSREYLLFLNKTVVIPTLSKPQNFNCLIPEFPTIPPSPEMLHLFLQTTPFKHIKDRDPLGFITFVDHLCSILPLAQGYWMGIPKEELESCIGRLHNVTLMYGEAVLAPNPSLPRQQNTILSLYVFIHQLAIRKDPELGEYKIDIKRFINANDAHTVILYESTELVRRQEIINYFNTHNNSKKRGHLFAQFEHMISYDWAKEIIKNPENFPEYDFMRRKFPDTQTACSAYSQRNRELTRVASDPEWFQLIEFCMLLERPKELASELTQTYHKLQDVAFFSHIFHGLWTDGVAYEIFSVLEKDKDSSIKKLKVKLRYRQARLDFEYPFLPMQSYAQEGQLKSLLTNCESRQEQLRRTENRILFRSPPAKDRSFYAQEAPDYDRLIACTQCKPSLQPYKILYYFQQHLSALVKPEMQSLFDLLFWKVDISVKSEGVCLDAPLFTALDNPQFRTQCAQFIEDGINRFLHSQKRANQAEHIFATLFFVRLLHRLKHYFPVEKRSCLKIDTFPILCHLIEKPDLSPEIKGSVALHLIQAYSLQDNLDKEAWQKIVILWMQALLYPPHPHFRYAELTSEIRTFLYSNAEKLQQNLDANTRNLNRIVTACQIPKNIDEEAWVGTFPYYHKQGENGQFISLNVLTGKVQTEMGIVGISHSVEITTQPDYIRLFGNQRFQIFYIDGWTHFLHPIYGNIRISMAGYTMILERQDSEGVWWQYLSPFRIYKIGTFPLTLIADYTHWVRVKNYDMTGHIEMEVYHLPTAQLTYRVNRNGLYTVEDSFRILPIEQSKLFDCFSRFETVDNIIARTTLNVTNNWLKIHSVHLSRYISLSGEPLIFDYDQEVQLFKWAKNPDYCLDMTSGSLPHLFWSCLLLNNTKEKKYQVLIPLTSFCRSQEFSRKEVLDTKDQVQRQIDPEFYMSIGKERSRYYLEYQLENKELIPLSQEAHLFLAYLYLGQKEYLKAGLLLKKFVNSIPLSKISKDILSKISDLSDLVSDHSANCAAVQIQAVLICNSQKKEPLPHALLERYHADASRIHAELKCSIEELDTSGIRSPPIHMIHSKTSLIDKDGFLTYEKPSQEQIDKLSPSEVQHLIWLTDLCRGIRSFGYYYHLACQTQLEDEKLAILNYLQIQLNFDPYRSFPIPFTTLFGLIGYALYDKQHRFPLPKETDDPKIKIDWLKRVIDLPKPRLKILTPPNVGQRQLGEMVSATLSLNKILATHRRMQETTVATSEPKADFTVRSKPLLDLQTLSDQFFEISSSSPSSFDTPQLIPPSSLKLPPNLQEFQHAIEEEFRVFGKELEQGNQIRQKHSFYTMRSDRNIGDLKKKLNELIDRHKQTVLEIETYVLSLINRKHLNPQTNLVQDLLIGAAALPLFTIEDCIDLFCNHFESGRFSKVYPFLSKEDTDIFIQLMVWYLTTSNEVAQAKRAVKLIEEIGKNNQETSLTVDKLARELAAKMSYSPQKNPEMLVFEHRMNLRIRPKQVDLIDQMMGLPSSDSKDIVVQLMMGEGKTSVLAPLILHLIAKKGFLPVFIAPSAQFESLRHNLGFSEQRVFSRKLRVIDLERAELTVENLESTLKVFKEAADQKEPILIKGEKVQAYELEFLHLSNCLAKEPRTKESEELLSKLKKLAQILRTLKEQSISLIDEVDLAMDPNHEVNFPEGEPTYLNPAYILLLQSIIQLHLRDDLEVEVMPGVKKDVKSVVGLQKNLAAHMPVSLYTSKVIPVIALELVRTYPHLRVPNHFYSSFVRFVTNQIQKGAETEGDQQFLSFLDQLHESPIEQDQEAASLICQSKHLFTDILPHSFQKVVGRHCGRTEGAKVGPYLAVDSPSPTLFGDEWEWAAAHFMTACVRGISSAQISEYANQLMFSATLFLKTHKTPFHETAEAREFFQLTGIQLEEIYNGDNLQKATEAVNQQPFALLAIEAETICSDVHFYKNYLSSNPQDFVAQFGRGRKKAFSGTPWNHRAYPASMQTVIWDEGVEGRIIFEMLKRTAQGQSQLHVVKKASAQAVLTQICNSTERASRIRGIIDNAGDFKDFSNEDVARDMLNYFKDDNQIQAVLFFGREKSTDILPDCLMAIRKGVKKAIVIGTTDKMELEKRGFHPAHYVCFYDQRHTEATDLLNLPNAVYCFSLDAKGSIRSTAQALLRLRGFLTQNQDVEFFALESSCQEVRDQMQLPNQVITPLEFICSNLINQAVWKAKDSFRAYKHRIRKVFRTHALSHLLTVYPKDIPGFFSRYQEVLISRRLDSPYELYRPLESRETPYNSLFIWANRWKKLVSDKIQNRDITNQIENGIKQILDEARKSPYLPTTVPQPQSDTQNMQIQLQLQVEMVQQVREIDQELQQELARYNVHSDKDVYTELPWGGLFNIKKSLCKNSKVDKPIDEPQVFSLNTFLQISKNGNPVYQRPYHLIFSSNLYVSSNWALTLSEFHPIFHKIKKPGEQVLVICEKEDQSIKRFSCILLSIEEGAFVQQALSKECPEDMWLLLCDGTEISTHAHFHDTEIQKRTGAALVEINFLNGNAYQLAYQPEETNLFLNQKGNRDLKIRFLNLKVESLKSSMPFQAEIFYRSSLFQTIEKERSSLARYKAHQRQAQRMAHLTPNDVETLEPDLVPSISNFDLIKHLKTRAQLQRLRTAQIPYASIQQIQDGLLEDGQISYLIDRDKINAVPNHQIDFIQVNCIRYLNQEKVRILKDLSRITLSQVAFVPPERINELPNHLIGGLIPDQVPYLSPTKVIWLQTKEQVERLSIDQLNQCALRVQEEAAQAQASIFPFLSGDQLTPFLASRFCQIFIPNLIKNPAQLQSITSKDVLQNVLKVSGEKIEDLVNKLSASQVHLLDDGQFRYLQVVSLIQAIPAAKIKHIISFQVKALIKEQIEQLPPEFVKEVPPNKCRYVPATPDYCRQFQGEQLCHLIPSQLEHITLKQLQSGDSAILKDVVPKLSEKSKLLQQKEVIPYVIPAQVPFLEPTLLCFLTTVDQIQAVPNESVKHLVGVQIPHLTQDQIPHLEDDQIRYLSEDQVKYIGLDEKKIQRVPGEKIHGLDEYQLKYVLIEQVNAAKPAYLQLIVPHLEDGLIGQLSGQAVAFVPPEKVHLISDAAYSRLGNNQVIHVALAKVPLIPPRLYHSLSPIQVNAVPDQNLNQLPTQQLQYLSKPDKIRRIDKDKACHFVEAQICHLSDDQISAISPLLVSKLPSEKLCFLTTKEQIQQVAPNLIDHLTEHQLKSLNEEQLKNIDPSSVSKLEPTQLALLSKPAQISQIEDRHYSYLTKEQLKIRFGGHAFATVLFLIGSVGWVLRLLSYCFLIPLLAPSVPPIQPLYHAISKFSWRLPIALRIWF